MAGYFAQHDVRVFLIGSGLRPIAAVSTRLLSSPHPILYDSDRSTYRAFGLEKRMGLIQMSGTFLVDRDGGIQYAHAVLNPFDSFRKREVMQQVENRGGGGGRPGRTPAP